MMSRLCTRFFPWHVIHTAAPADGHTSAPITRNRRNLSLLSSRIRDFSAAKLPNTLITCSQARH
jgi:hypothetical protein